MSTFDQAAADWMRLSASENPDDFDALEKVERFLLTHRPKDFKQLATILAVIASRVEGGGCSDGRDASALRRLSLQTPRLGRRAA
ncbi:hypothetical protein [Brevundimonas sp.]|uniref:hypothetical protein n=1 Tax=Brevundimonas sp. TaxID=1871086 RepID=UPI002FDB7A46